MTEFKDGIFVQTVTKHQNASVRELDASISEVLRQIEEKRVEVQALIQLRNAKLR